MPAHPTARRSWLHGFATGVAVCGLTLYAKRKVGEKRPRLVRDEGVEIPIE